MIYFVGYMGVGKTRIAKKLGDNLGLLVCDTDQEIEKQEKTCIKNIFMKKGENYFRKKETDLLKKINDKLIISCGGGTAVYNNNMTIINNKGISIYLRASHSYLYEKLKNNNKNRPLISNISSEDLEKHIKKDLSNREIFYNKAKYTVNIENKSDYEILREIKTLILSA